MRKLEINTNTGFETTDIATKTLINFYNQSSVLF